MAQWVKDLAFPQLWHRSQLWHGFDPRPGNFHMPCVQPKKKKKKIVSGEKSRNLKKYLKNAMRSIHPSFNTYLLSSVCKLQDSL